MKHMKAVPQSKSKLAISAGLSALMVFSSLGVAPVMAFADQTPTPKKTAVQNFEAIAKQVITYDAKVLHPNAKQDKLNEYYRMGGTVTPDATKPDQKKAIEGANAALVTPEYVQGSIKGETPITDNDVINAIDSLGADYIAGNNLALDAIGNSQEGSKVAKAVVKVEEIANTAESEGLSFTAKYIREAKTVETATNLLKEAEKSAIETMAQKAEKEGLKFYASIIRQAQSVNGARAWLQIGEAELPVKPAVIDPLIELLAKKAESEGFTFAAKQIRNAKTVEGARALLEAAEKTKPEPKPEPQPQPQPEPKPSQDKDEDYYGHDEKYTKDDNNPWMEGYSMEDHIDAMEKSYKDEKAGDKAAAELRKEINKNLGVSADDTSTLPGSDDNVYPTDPKMDVAAPSADGAKTPAAPSADGSVAPTQASDESAAPEEGKAEGKKALPQTNDFLATLLPMLGVALGGTSIAFGKRMRH